MKENDFGYENLKNFTYIDCVLNESHYGPVNQIITHKSIQDYNADGISIRKNTMFRLQPSGPIISKNISRDQEIQARKMDRRMQRPACLCFQRFHWRTKIIDWKTFGQALS